MRTRSIRHESNRPKPREGETFVHCGHVFTPSGDLRPVHFFQFPNGVTFRRFAVASAASTLVFDGEGTAHWLLACDACYAKSGGEAQDIEIQGHDEWSFTGPTYK